MFEDVLILKKGGIHIKKKNRGSFTRWCKGKVTEECIRRGKNSSNPAIRKKATFAANARRWKHENGGILKAQDSAKLSSGYTQYNGSDLSDIETFNKNWLNYRNSQLANQGWKDETIKNKLNWFQRNFGASDKTVANLVREQLFSNLDNTKELSFSDALKDSQGRYLLTESMYADFPGERKLHEVEVGPPKPIEDWKLDYSFNGSVGGTHYPDFNTIIYNDLYQNTPVKIHERDHAMFGKYNDKNIGLKIVEDIFKQDFLDNVVDKWSYYDEPSEIRARLMQMRYNNRLDPNHKYTFDEIENMRNDSTFIDEHIFDRYTNKYIEYLLNDVAQNTINKNRLDYKSPINFIKDGGTLKAQEGTGNGFWSKLWNAVKEGGMAARDAKLGAVGAQQVRDLYSEGKNQEAQDLAKQYAKANTTGIALAGGAASTGLLGDLMVTGATTAADTFIGGDTENFGKNLVKNTAGDLIGHGVFKGLRYFNGKPIFVKEMENGIGDGLYHLDYGDAKGAFKSGSYIKNGYLYPGKTDSDGQLDYIWFNESKPYATAVRDKPFSRTIIFDQKDIPGILRVREQNYPIGQWNGKSGFVTKHEMVTSNPVAMDNASIYKRIPAFNIWLRTK